MVTCLSGDVAPPPEILSRDNILDRGLKLGRF